VDHRDAAARASGSRYRPIASVTPLRRLLRDYPEPPLRDALRDAARYGLYDPERIETMVLRNIRHDYFPRRDSNDIDHE
jgi:hypothetical protein